MQKTEYSQCYMNFLNIRKYKNLVMKLPPAKWFLT